MLLVFVSVLLINIDAHTQALAPVRALFGLIATPFHQLVLWPDKLSTWFAGRAMSTPELLDELDELRGLNLQLQVRQQQIDGLQAENRRLRQLLSASPQGLDRVMLAELVDVSLEPFSQTMLINKGLLDDVYTGQPVLDAAGVMGQVTRTSYLKSAVALITDPGQTIPVIVERNGFRALTTGTGSQNNLNVPYLDRNTDIRKNDLLLTSGMGGRFPYGYPVATVREVTVDVNEPFLQVRAEPVARLGFSREVIMVWPGELPVEQTDEPTTDEATTIAPNPEVENAIGQ
jgi:rod shape-determining protein MreC